MFRTTVTAVVHTVDVKAPREDGQRALVSLTLLTETDVVRCWGFSDAFGLSVPEKGDDVSVDLVIRPARTAGLSIQVVGIS